MFAWFWSWLPDYSTPLVQAPNTAPVQNEEELLPRPPFSVSAEELQEGRTHLKPPIFDAELLKARSGLPRPVWIAVSKDEELLRSFLSKRREALDGF